MKVALIGADHWHVPLYLPALSSPGIDIVGASAPAGQPVDLGNAPDCRVFRTSRDLLAAVEFDFAFVFGRHCDMAQVAQSLIENGIPFAIEKPCGVNAGEVAQLRDAAAAKQLFVAVPFVQRLGAIGAELIGSELFPARGYQHLSFRFIGGPIARYEQGRSEWMLDRNLAGGGALINLGIHFVDLVAAITQSDVVSVSARTSSFRSDINVEEYAVLTLQMQSGAVACLEAGYLWPQAPGQTREFNYAISHSNAYVRGGQDILEIVDRHGAQRRHRTDNLNPDLLYAVFANETLRAFRSGQPPLADLADAATAMSVVSAAYESAQSGGTSIVVKYI